MRRCKTYRRRCTLFAWLCTACQRNEEILCKTRRYMSVEHDKIRHTDRGSLRYVRHASLREGYSYNAWAMVPLRSSLTMKQFVSWEARQNSFCAVADGSKWHSGLGSHARLTLDNHFNSHTNPQLSHTNPQHPTASHAIPQHPTTIPCQFQFSSLQNFHLTTAEPNFVHQHPSY